ncbi:MarR family winged helix-turn-helix transcriptional regulator [Cupriavidus pauculus]|uniref:MarR family winged helix-turn-helix transcriptional regulator n=1 Tax=Cupriavidus pauculus TaxID=82633 RepID=UPI000A6925B4
MCAAYAYRLSKTMVTKKKLDSPVTLTPEAEIEEERLAHLVKDAARAYIRALQLRLAEHSVSYGHWTILRILWRHDGLSQRELSERAGVTEPTTFAAVKALEALGYVERTHLPGNKKKVHVFLSKTGRALRRKLEPLATEVNTLSVEGVSEEDVLTTRRVLITIAQRLVADEMALAERGRRVPSTQEVGRLLADL